MEGVDTLTNAVKVTLGPKGRNVVLEKFGDKSMKFKPLHDRVLVEREESDEKSAGGIIIPDTAKEKPMQGKIIAVGSGSKDEQGKVTPLDVKAGDTVLSG